MQARPSSRKRVAGWRASSASTSNSSGAVEAEIAFRPRPAAAGDRRRRISASRRDGGAHVDHDQVVADGVETAHVAADEARGRVGRSAALLEEDAIAQFLRPPDILLGRRQARLERARARQHRPEPVEIALAGEPSRNRRTGRRPAAPRCECQRHPASPLICCRPKAEPCPPEVFMTPVESRPKAHRAPSHRRVRSSRRRSREIERLDEEGVEARGRAGPPLVVEPVGGQRDDRRRRGGRLSASSRRKRRVASKPSRPGILRSIRMRSKAAARRGPRRRRAAAPPRRRCARTTSKPSRRSAFCAISALMSLSSASSARRRGSALDRPGGLTAGEELRREPLEQRARAHRLHQPAVEALRAKSGRRRGARTAKTAPGSSARPPRARPGRACWSPRGRARSRR